MFKRLKEIALRAKQIETELAEADEARCNELMAELDKLTAEKTQLEARASKVRGQVAESITNKGSIADDQEEAGEDATYRSTNEMTRAEYRAVGEALKHAEPNKRTKVLDSTILVPKYMGNVVQPYPWDEVSGILDLVTVRGFSAGDTYTEPYQITQGEGEYTLEPKADGTGGTYASVDTSFDFVDITRNKITAYTEISKEFRNYPSGNYGELVVSNVSSSIKRKIVKEIFLGDGNNKHFVGLLSTKLKANTYNDEVLASIDENTLTNIVIDFGGTLAVEDEAVLIMNKLTLKEFAKVRGANKEKVYNIVMNGKTATIDGIRVVFSQHIKPFSEATNNDFWLLYGNFRKYIVTQFQGIQIEESSDFKFSQGLIAIRGDAYQGGNLAGYKAITRYKKSAGTGI